MKEKQIYFGTPNGNIYYFDENGEIVELGKIEENSGDTFGY